MAKNKVRAKAAKKKKTASQVTLQRDIKHKKKFECMFNDMSDKANAMNDLNNITDMDAAIMDSGLTEGEIRSGYCKPESPLLVSELKGDDTSERFYPEITPEMTEKKPRKPRAKRVVEFTTGEKQTETIKEAVKEVNEPEKKPRKPRVKKTEI